MTSPSASPLSAWTMDRRVLALLALVAALAAVYSYRKADPDLWGHLKYGQLFLAQGSQIAKDPYAYTTSGQHWSTHEYLAQMALALAYNWGGPAGLLVLKCLLGAGAIACLYACLRTCTPDPRLWAPLFMLSAISLGRWFQFRPQLFTYLFLAFYVLILFRHLLGRTKLLWLLPLLMPLWVNLHGGFLAGLGAVGLALAGRCLQSINRHGLDLKKVCGAAWPLLLTLAGCVVGSLFNPLGWRLYSYLRTEFGHSANGRYLEEWQPVPLTQYWTVIPLALLLGLLLLLTVLAELRARRDSQADVAGLAPWQWLLSCLPLVVMALLSQRHIPILTIWATPVLGILANTAFADAPESSWRDRVCFAISGLITMLTLVALSIILRDLRPGISIEGSLGSTHPHGVMAFLRKHNLEGNLYTPLWWGSYFTWELRKHKLEIYVSMDGRNVTLFKPQDVTDNLVFYSEKNPDLEIPFKTKEKPRFLVIPADASVLKLVREDKRWLLVYEDDQASLFVRKEESDQMEQWKKQPLSASELAIPQFLE
jgi:hypothetical protein